MQIDTKRIDFNKTYFEGCITEVLNRHRDISLKFKDWTTFTFQEFNGVEARRIINEFYKGYERLVVKEIEDFERERSLRKMNKMQSEIK